MYRKTETRERNSEIQEWELLAFNLVSKLPRELIQVEALGRPFTITEAF